MFNKIKNTVKKIDADEFVGNFSYNTIIFGLVLQLYLIYKESIVKTNKYIFLFLFLLVSYCLIKYFLSCKQKFVPLLKGKFSLSSIIIIGYLVDLVSGLVILKLMDFFYGKIEVLNQQLIEKQLTDYPDMANLLFFDSVFSAPLMEEVIFRGLLLNAILFIGLNLGISKRFLFIVFIIITSLLFGCAHQSNNMLTFIYFALGGLNLGV
ncbi:TPA: lysostaphin resistance A-like protein, partial [Enterococcus hirae]